MTIEEVMSLAAVCETPRDWAELRASLLALAAQARDEEAEACVQLCCDQPTRIALFVAQDIRARIAARAEGRSHG